MTLLILENAVLITLLEELEKKGCVNLEDAKDLIIKKNFQLEGDKGEIDFYGNSSKSEFFLSKLKIEIKNSIERNYEKNISKLTYSLKTKKVTIHFCDGKTISKKQDEVAFDLMGITGAELFNFLS